MSHSRTFALLACLLLATTVIFAQPSPVTAQRGAIIGGTVGIGVGAAITEAVLPA